ncbi:MAG: hypothetical protein NZ481_07555, partial [Candidatus Kapabacteria bacterium]|nr:hypothetical protein [Candidatus Kapabacteria bacterium]
MVLVCSAYGQRPSYPIVLGVSGGIAMGIGSSQLFEGYRQATGLRSNDFNVPLTAGAVVFVDVGGLRLGASSDVYFAQSLERGTPQNAPQRVLEEDLRLTMMPVLFTVEWEPWREQFRTFVSAGVGAAFARFQWYESVWSNGRQERWRINADMRKTVPALRLATG